MWETCYCSGVPALLKAPYFLGYHCDKKKSNPSSCHWGGSFIFCGVLHRTMVKTVFQTEAKLLMPEVYFLIKNWSIWVMINK